MISQNSKQMGRFTTFVRHAPFSAPPANAPAQLGQLPGREDWQTFLVPPLCTIITDGAGNYRAVPLHSATSAFKNLPGATSVAAGKDDIFVSLGVGTEVIARAAKGGINVKTQASSPATADDAMIVGVANNGSNVPLTAAAQPRFATRVALTQITLELFFAGLNETITAVDPLASAGDGAGFVFDPTNAESSGLAAAVYQNNWLCYQKVGGADVFTDSGIAVVAATDYDLEVIYDINLVPTFLINGDVVGTGTAGTTGHTLGTLVGVKIIDAGTPVQHDFDLRWISTERFIG